jgi:hypothetical protein
MLEVGAAMSLFSWLSNLLYVWMVRKLDDHEKKQNLIEKKKFKPKHSLGFPLFFWMIVLGSFLFSMCWTPFLHINA